MANELSITYNGQTKTKDSGVVLSTAGRVMVTDMTITAAADPHTLYTPNSTYFKTGTSGAVSAASIPQNNYPSATYYVKAATPAFDGGALSASGTANATATNATLSSTNNSGIAITASGNATPSRASVLYNGAVAGWVSKADNAVALDSSTGSAVALTSATYYINSVTIPSGKTLNADLYGNFVPYDDEGSGTITINSDDCYGKVKVDDTTVYDQGLVTADPAFDGGTVSGSITIPLSATNASLTSSDTASGISISVGIISSNISRASVLYNGAVSGWVTKADDTTALTSTVVTAGLNKSNIVINGIGTRYINNITVPTGKTLTVTSVIGTMDVNSSSTVVAGTVNINGGAINRGVQVKANKEAVVDGFTITYSTTATVNGVTFYAGDLKVPVWNSTNRNIEFPDPGVFSSAAGTTSLSIAGTITSINGLAIKDSGTTVTGSGTASAGTYDMYLAKWSTASSLTTGPHVTISSSTPSGGSNGDIWYQIL